MEPPKLQAIDLSDQIYYSSYSNKPRSNSNNNNNVPVVVPPQQPEQQKKKKKKNKKTTKFDEAMKQYEARSETYKAPKPVYHYENLAVQLRNRFFPMIVEIQVSTFKCN